MTLIVYDLSGKVWNIMTGNYVKPTGIPYLEVEVPVGKIVSSVDVSVTPHVPVYLEMPIPAIQTFEERLILVEGIINEMNGL